MIACPYCKTELTPPASANDEDSVFACAECLNPIGIRNEGIQQAFVLPGERDTRTVATPESVGGRILERLRAPETELPVLPEISHRVWAAIQSEKTSMSDLAAIVREDSSIAANVLRVANSAAYGGLHSVSELTAACSRLGQKTVANVVQSVASKSVFDSDDAVVRGLME